VHAKRIGLLLALGLALTGCASPAAEPDNPAGVRVSTTRDPSGLRGAVLAQPYPKPALTFTDTAGRPFPFVAATAGKPVTLVFFGYTYCPDVCNQVLADVAVALRRLEPGLRPKVGLVFITTDPARDSPAVIREYLDRFDKSFVGLTGSLRSIETAARTLGVQLTGQSKLPGGGYEVGHGAQVIGFGPDGKAHVVWTQGTSIGDLKHDFGKLADSA
jgi:protein SCO1